MNYYENASFNKLYFLMLQDAYNQDVQLTESRVGKVKDLGRTVYQVTDDSFRLCFLKGRDINPFFALTEFSWVIEGSNLLEPLQYFISSYNQFSDDGKVLNGAYGFRLRKYFGIDQIEKAIIELMNCKTSRRVVLTMYSHEDLSKDSRDIPCNTTIYLKIKKNKLDITILNRSNDLFLGVPYNVFIFNLLQIYIAKRLDCEIGIQTHYTDSLHLYEKDFIRVANIIKNNSLEIISKIEKDLNTYNFQNYVFINHANILEQKFINLQDLEIKNIFLLYASFKEKKSVIDSSLIPDNLLGYCVYHWLKNRKNISIKKISYFEVDNYEKGVSAIQVLNSLKYKETDEIIKSIEELNILYLPKINTFKNIICDFTKDNSIFTLDLNDEIKFINIILLAIMLESISSNLYNIELREILMNKMRKICNILNVNLNDVFYFSKYENDILKILN